MIGTRIPWYGTTMSTMVPWYKYNIISKKVPYIYNMVLASVPVVWQYQFGTRVPWYHGSVPFWYHGMGTRASARIVVEIRIAVELEL